LDLEEREVPLAVLRRPDLPHDRVPGPEVEALDLGRADVDVVRPVEIIPVLRPEEAVPLGEDFQDALAPEHDVAIEEVLFDSEDEVLLTEAGVVGDVQLLGHLVQLSNRLALQFRDVHESLHACNGTGFAGGRRQPGSNQSGACRGQNVTDRKRSARRPSLQVLVGIGMWMIATMYHPGSLWSRGSVLVSGLSDPETVHGTTLPAMGREARPRARVHDRGPERCKIRTRVRGGRMRSACAGR